MKPTINKKQFIAIYNLINNLNDIQQKNIAVIKDMITMVNFNFANSIFLRYEKEYFSDGAKYEYKIAEIDINGTIKVIDEKFNNVFERYSFLGECKTFDIENPNDYEKVD